MKVKNLPSSNDCIMLEIEIAILLTFMEYLPFYQLVRTLMKKA